MMKRSVWDILILRCGDIHVETHSFVPKVFIEHLLCTAHCAGDPAVNQPNKNLCPHGVYLLVGGDVGERPGKK